MKWRVGIAIILSFCMSEYARALELEKYIAEVERTNLPLKAAESRAAALSHRVNPSRTWDDPFFAAGPDEIVNGKPEVIRFQLSQSIPFPGKLAAKGKVAESRANEARADSETYRRQIRIAATQIFYRGVLLEKAISLNRKSHEILQGSVASTRSRYTTGGGGHHDWLLARMEVSLLGVEKLRLERERVSAVAILNEFRDQPPETPIEKFVAPLSTKFARDREVSVPSTKEQPEIKSASSAVIAAEAERKSARLAYLPDFVVQGMLMKPQGMSENAEMSQTKWGLMVGVTLPLFFLSKQSEVLAAANHDLEANLSLERNLRRRLESEMLSARQQLKTAEDTVALYRDSIIPTTELAEKSARTEYSARRQPITRLLDTLRIQRVQDLEYTAAQIDVQLAHLRLNEVLSSPPAIRLAPLRPTFFSSSEGMGSRMGSDTVSVGDGMSGPTRKDSAAKSPPGDSSSSGGMEGM